MDKGFLCPDYHCVCPLGLKEMDNQICSRCWVIPEKTFVKNTGNDSTIFLGRNRAPYTKGSRKVTESCKTRYIRVSPGEKKP